MRFALIFFLNSGMLGATVFLIIVSDLFGVKNGLKTSIRDEGNRKGRILLNSFGFRTFVPPPRIVIMYWRRR